MFKLIRTTLADYKEFIWPGHGTVKWIYIQRLHQIQEKHGIRLGGNKVNHRHINFRQNKMKANLAVQTMASRSVAVNLKWLNQEKISGFEDQDCKTTAEFIQLHNDLLDVLNSRKLSDPGYKQARTEKNAIETATLFDKVRRYGFT